MNKKVLVGVIGLVVILAIAAAFALPSLLRGHLNTPEGALLAAMYETANAETCLVEGEAKIDWAPIDKEFDNPVLKPFVDKASLAFRVMMHGFMKQGAEKQIDYGFGFRYSGGTVWDILFRADTERMSLGSSTPYPITAVASHEELWDAKIDYGKYIDILTEQDAALKKVAESKEFLAALKKAYEGAVLTKDSAMPNGEKGTLVEVKMDAKKSRESQLMLVDYYFSSDDLFHLIQSRAKKILKTYIDSKDYLHVNTPFAEPVESLQKALAEMDTEVFRKQVDETFETWKSELIDGEGFGAHSGLLDRDIPESIRELIEQEVVLKYWIKNNRLAFLQTTVQTAVGPMNVNLSFHYDVKREAIKDSDATIDIDNFDLFKELGNFIKAFEDNKYALELFEDLSNATGQDINPDSLMMLLMMGMRAF